jgi:hypothetical protein
MFFPEGSEDTFLFYPESDRTDPIDMNQYNSDLHKVDTEIKDQESIKIEKVEIVEYHNQEIP